MQQMYVQCCFTLLHNSLTLSKRLSPTVNLLIVECWPNISSLLWKNRASFWENVVGGPARPVRKHLHNGKAQWDLKSQLVDTFPHQQAAKRRCTHTVRMGRRSGKFKSPLPHIYPVWQRFITEANSTRKSGRTFVRFTQLNAVEMGQNISWLCYDTMTQNSCFASVDLYYVEMFSACVRADLTCLWLWRDSGSVKTMSRLRSFFVLHSIAVKCWRIRKIQGPNGD